MMKHKKLKCRRKEIKIWKAILIEFHCEGLLEPIDVVYAKNLL